MPLFIETIKFSLCFRVIIPHQAHTVGSKVHVTIVLRQVPKLKSDTVGGHFQTSKQHRTFLEIREKFPQMTSIVRLRRLFAYARSNFSDWEASRTAKVSERRYHL